MTGFLTSFVRVIKWLQKQLALFIETNSDVFCFGFENRVLSFMTFHFCFSSAIRSTHQFFYAFRSVSMDFAFSFGQLAPKNLNFYSNCLQGSPIENKPLPLKFFAIHRNIENVNFSEKLMPCEKGWLEKIFKPFVVTSDHITKESRNLYSYRSHFFYILLNKLSFYLSIGMIRDLLNMMNKVISNLEDKFTLTIISHQGTKREVFSETAKTYWMFSRKHWSISNTWNENQWFIQIPSGTLSFKIRRWKKL